MIFWFDIGWFIVGFLVEVFVNAIVLVEILLLDTNNQPLCLEFKTWLLERQQSTQGLPKSLNAPLIIPSMEGQLCVVHFFPSPVWHNDKTCQCRIFWSFNAKRCKGGAVLEAGLLLKKYGPDARVKVQERIESLAEADADADKQSRKEWTRILDRLDTLLKSDEESEAGGE